MIWLAHEAADINEQQVGRLAEEIDGFEDYSSSNLLSYYHDQL